jgi:hypothetical protein
MRASLAARFAKVEEEIARNAEFNQEFMPSKRKRLRAKRWEFGSLDRENDEINSLARRAFDPMNVIYSNPRRRDAPEYDEISAPPPIDQPHRVRLPATTLPRPRARPAPRDDDIAFDFSPEPRARPEPPARGREVRQLSPPRISLESDCDRFIDEIDSFRRW